MAVEYFSKCLKDYDDASTQKTRPVALLPKKVEVNAFNVAMRKLTKKHRLPDFGRGLRHGDQEATKGKEEGQKVDNKMRRPRTEQVG